MATDNGIYERMFRLAKQILQRTKENKLNWTPTEKGNRFSFSGRASSVWIEGQYDSDGDFVGELTLLDPSGFVVERLRTAFKEDDAQGVHYVGLPQNAILAELHELARRRALKVDDVIDGLIEDLGE